MTHAERSQLREYGRQAGWRAALNVLALEARIALICARQLTGWHYLSEEDEARLALAVTRIDDAQAVLNGRN
jgi:hypothetical protein